MMAVAALTGLVVVFMTVITFGDLFHKQPK